MIEKSLPIEIKKIEKDTFIQSLEYLNKFGCKYYLRNDILKRMREFFDQEKIPKERYETMNVFTVLKNCPELIIDNDFYLLLYRYKIAKYNILKIDKNTYDISHIQQNEYLNIRDSIIVPEKKAERTICLDFLPFYDYAPSIKNPNDIGNGFEYLNKHMSSSIFQNPEKWNDILFNFLQIHSMNDQQLLINKDKIKSSDMLLRNIEYITEKVMKDGSAKSKKVLEKEMDELGFMPGWGNSKKRIKNTMLTLLDLFNSPDKNRLEDFLTRIPMISKIAIISPHGFFAQKNVLGLPDTGGQVVYILDQVKYLEKILIKNLKDFGIEIKPKIIILTRLIPDSPGTTCNKSIEKINDTENTYIIRIPFRDDSGSIINEWVSRFKLWKYLDNFAYEAKDVLLKEFQGTPDLIIGNYSDGNLVASILSKETGVTQCNIAHALEKSKYLFSDLYWKDMDNDYHFSIQFTADLISMNMASFIVTSTYQEIAGTMDARGQYESYLLYSMPGLYHVINGINLFHPKFNVIPPGVAEDVYFPFYKKDSRDSKKTKRLESVLFDIQDDDIYGILDDKTKTPVFAMSRLDKIKNISGLVKAFGNNKKLTEISNLIIIAGKIDLNQSNDEEERNEIRKIYEYIDKYNLKGNIRWIGKMMDKADAGEIYRIIADRKGIFIQPALFEAFGLTVLESMASGLPVFATKFGGPSEIIQDSSSGFLINPTIIDEMSEKIAGFIKNSKNDPAIWTRISENGIKRLERAYNWRLYSKNILKLAKIHGFWKYGVSTEAKKKMKLYCDLIYDNYIKKEALNIKQ